MDSSRATETPRAMLGWLVTMIRRKPLLAQAVKRLRHVGGDDHLGDRHWRKRLTVADERFIKYAVAIEEYCSA